VHADPFLPVTMSHPICFIQLASWIVNGAMKQACKSQDTLCGLETLVTIPAVEATCACLPALPPARTHQDVLLAALLVQAVRNGGGGGLVDDARDVQAGDGA